MPNTTVTVHADGTVSVSSFPVVAADDQLNRLRLALLETTMLNAAPANLLGLWPLDDALGVLARDVSGHNRHGIYSGVGTTLNQSVAPFTCPVFTGVLGQGIDLFSPTLASVFDGGTGSVLLFAQAPQTAAPPASRIAVYGQSSAGAILSLDRASNLLGVSYGDDAAVTHTTTADVWHSVAATWAGNAVTLYVNGAIIGSAGTSILWSGSFANLTLAASNSGSNRWIGSLAYCGLWNVALPAPQIAAIHTASGI